MKSLLIYLGVILLMSLVAFIAYLSDKRKAQRGKWRIKESVLLGLGILGGAIGALAAMNIFRHKTKHWYFWIVNIVALTAQAALAVVVFTYLS